MEVRPLLVETDMARTLPGKEDWTPAPCGAGNRLMCAASWMP